MSLADGVMNVLKSKNDNGFIEYLERNSNSDDVEIRDYSVKFINYFDSFLNNSYVFLDGILKPRLSFDTSISIHLFFSDRPHSFTIYVKDDNSYAIGIDFRYVLIMQELGTIGLYLVDNGYKPIPYEAYDNFLLVFTSNILQLNSIYKDNLTKRANRFLSSLTQYEEHRKTLTLFTIWFIVSHEFAHIYLNHLCSEVSFIDPSPNDSDTIPTFNNTQEYDADAWAFSILQEEFKEKDYLENYFQMAPLLFYSICELIESAMPRQLFSLSNTSNSGLSWMDRYNRLKQLQIPNRKSDMQYINDIITPLECLPDTIINMKEFIRNNLFKIKY